MLLVRPSKLYKDKIIDFKMEFLENDEIIPGGELLDKLDFDEWIDYVSRNSDIDTVSDDWVLTDVFFCFDNDDIVGVISFRHWLNEFLKDWGHIGYSVRPSHRNRGIASFMLGEVINNAKILGLEKLQLSSYNDNLASIKTILKHDGIFIRSFDYLEKSVNVYIIRL